MKLITWNIDSLRVRLSDFLGIVKECQPDLLCLQEIRCTNEMALKLKPEGNYSIYPCESDNLPHGGTASYCKNKPILVSSGNVTESVKQTGRVQVIYLGNCYVINIYMKNAGKSLCDFPEKKASMEWLIDFASQLDQHKPVILVGDFNAATYFKDIRRQTDRLGTTGFSPQEQELFLKLKDRGFVDTLTYKFPHENDLVKYLDDKEDKPNNLSNPPISDGFRLDYILVSDRLTNRIQSVDVLTEYKRHDSHLPLSVDIDL